MNNDYLIIHKSILPEFFDLVIRARDMIENEGLSVSAACQRVDISRSTYYKYKDFIFYPSNSLGRKAIFSIKAMDVKGVLSAVLNAVYENKMSVLAINAGLPIKNNAYITLTLDLQDYNQPIDELIAKFKAIKHVKSASIIAIE